MGKKEAIAETCRHGAQAVMQQGLDFLVAHPVLGGSIALGGAAVVGGAAYGAYRLARKAFPLLLAPLYSRLTKGDVASHPARAALLAAIRETPGVTTADLARRTGLAEGTLGHHLRTLERAGFVKSLLSGRDRLWFEAGVARPAPGDLALLDPSRRGILDHANREPGLTQTDLARLTGLALPTVHHHVRALADVGLVEVRRDGASTRVYPASATSKFALRPRI